MMSKAVCYASVMDPLHATIENFAADGFTHRNPNPRLGSRDGRAQNNKETA
jgi:hypothetical protein